MSDLMNESSFEATPPPTPPAPSQEPPPSAFPIKPMLIFGMAMIFFGVMAVLENLGIPNMHIVFKLWPLILIFMGVAKIRQDGSSGGYALVIGGTFALMVVFGHGHIEEFIGPMILVGAGIFVIVKSLNKHRGIRPNQKVSDDMVSGSAIFSSFKRRMVSQAFQGGDLTSIFGGFEVDLRQAAIQGEPARLDVFIMFGGGELKVPDDWRVDVQASAIFGGIEDKTYSQGQALREGQPRLVITGMALFGGLEVRH